MSADELEAFLGDPHEAGSVLSYPTAVATDARGEPVRHWTGDAYAVPA